MVAMPNSPDIVEGKKLILRFPKRRNPSQKAMDRLNIHGQYEQGINPGKIITAVPREEIYRIMDLEFDERDSIVTTDPPSMAEVIKLPIRGDNGAPI